VLERGMEGILTELPENNVSRINEKVSYKVPAPAIHLFLQTRFEFNENGG